MSQDYKTGIRKSYPKIENHEFKTALFRFNLTNETVAKRLGMSRSLFNHKLNRGLLSQVELKVILEMIREFDSSVTPDIFFDFECDR